jgi:hypothetical protein
MYNARAVICFRKQGEYDVKVTTSGSGGKASLSVDVQAPKVGIED